MPDEHRMIIYANSNVTRGKYAAAAVHAALTAVGAHHGGPVIVLGAKPAEIAQHATVIRDAGRTEVEPGTITAGTDFLPGITAVAEPSDQIKQLLRDLVDPDPCSFDHHGGCQAHGYISLEPGELCPHAEAKALFATWAEIPTSEPDQHHRKE